ncbi:glutamate-5-semialdehyde dehydrogenase [Actinoplanes sp. NPDC020271]|uniref:glutamate-5-semialdehyde dehydrogenase n=1 Tax=Actinoplanes sp. NPDC020271 TaxID=3363896 RepID=UPI0037A84DF1
MMDATAIDECLADCRRTLGDAPPIGDPAYPRFVAAVRRILDERWVQVVAANQADLGRCRERGLPDGMLHRMTLTDAHRDAAFALTGRLPAEIERAVTPSRDVIGPHGTRSRRIARPLGVLLMIYESRPSVTIDGALLPVCAGNVVLLRGGSEIAGTNAALAEVFEQALREAGLPTGMVRVLHDVDRAGLRMLLAREDAIDVLIPRGSPSLTDACRSLSKIPMIVGGGGVNHLYVHASADLDLAVRIVLDGKLHEPEGCTALETVLLDAAVAGKFWQTLMGYGDELAGCGLTVRVDADVVAAIPAEIARVVAVEPRSDSDFGREFLDRTLCVSTVGDADDAVKHVRRHGSAHTEAIVTGSDEVADSYCAQIDAAMVIVNGSVRLHDAPTLGLGCEIAISTSRLHVRGPVTLADLMSYSWRVDGAGTLRFRKA